MKIDIRFKQVADLAFCRFDHLNYLESKGIAFASPSIEFASLWGNADEIEESRLFVCEYNGNLIYPSESFRKKFIALKQEGQQRYKESEDSSDLSFPSLKRNFSKELANSHERTNKVKREYQNRLDTLKANNVESFCSGSYRNVDPQKSTAAMVLCRCIFNRHGWMTDKALSRAHFQAFSKVLKSGLVFAVLVDKKLIGLQVDVQSNPEQPVNIPLFESHLLLQLGTGEKREFPVSCFFPINEFPLGTNSFKEFLNLKELDGLMHIHLLMIEFVERKIDDIFLHSAKSNMDDDD